MSAKVRPDRGRLGVAGNKTKVQPIAKSVDVVEKGLPSNLDAERFVLASVLLDDRRFIEVAALNPDDFSLERHRCIFGCMQDLQSRSEHIDRVTVAEELARRNELGPDGLGYLASLDDGMPPQLDVATAMDYRRQADKLLRQGGQAERKQLLRTLVGEVANAPGFGGEYQPPPARGHYEWLGCGGLLCSHS